MSAASRHQLAALRAEIAALERGGRAASDVLSLGDPLIDARLPGGGLARGAWHAFAGEGLEIETAAATAAFTARLAVPLVAHGELVWVMRRDDLHAPGLAGLGLPAD